MDPAPGEILWLLQWHHHLTSNPPQIVNINLVPPQYRVLFANVVALVWNSYLATIQAQNTGKRD